MVRADKGSRSKPDHPQCLYTLLPLWKQKGNNVPAKHGCNGIGIGRGHGQGVGKHRGQDQSHQSGRQEFQGQPGIGIFRVYPFPEKKWGCTTWGKKAPGARPRYKSAESRADLRTLFSEGWEIKRVARFQVAPL